MDLTYVIAGRLTREYILPHAGPPLMDAAGGSALYAAGGLLVWAGGVGILARVGEDYPRAWLQSIAAKGIDVRGIKILPQTADMRQFVAYDARLEETRGSPVSQFARRQLPFPKALLGYQQPAGPRRDPGRPEDLAPNSTDLPGDYLDARAVHLCPLDLSTHTQLVATFKGSGATTITLELTADYALPALLPELRLLLPSVTAFLCSERHLRALFWGYTYDLWEMMDSIGSFGCEIVAVRRSAGEQAVLDVKGKHRHEIPAYPARPADPTGIGDAYAGGFLAGYKQTYDALQAALHANVSASLAVEGSGAFYPLAVLHGLAEARLHQLRDSVITR